MMLQENLLQTAQRLAVSSGLPAPVALERMSGGRNNRVYRVSMADGGLTVLKSYFHDPRDPRDRLAAEWSFLSHGWAQGIRTIPRPLACDQETHSALYSFVEGRKLDASELAAEHIDAAADFVLRVNVAVPRTDRLPPASEACFSIAEHLATVDRRVAQLGALDPAAPHRDSAERLIDAVLLPSWEQVRGRIVDQAAEMAAAVDSPLPCEERVISPSDFGFHNALAGPDGVLVFIDFEYAGLDDPAKLVCDFFCQPEVTVPLAHFDRFLNIIVGGLGLPAGAAVRSRLLLDAYRIKWACIILNEFRPLGAARRTFAETATWQERCIVQLRKAEAKMAEIGSL